MCPTRAQLLGPAGADNAVQGQADAFEKTLNQSWNVELSWPGRQEAIAMWRWTRSNRRQQGLVGLALGQLFAGESNRCHGESN